MVEPIDDMTHRLEALEQRVARPPAASEMRSARSVVGRVDDVWVAVTEGNERTALLLVELRGRLSAVEAAVGELSAGLADVNRQMAALARSTRRERRAAGPPSG